MDRDSAIKYLNSLLGIMKLRNGSDLFLTVGFPPAIKGEGRLKPVSDMILTEEQTSMLVRCMMTDRQVKEFEGNNECNFAISPGSLGRYRVNAFVQQGKMGAVLRTINTTIPDFDEMKLPNILREVALTKRGLVLLVGATGSGKSTSLAAMVGYRNAQTEGHIITIEDPIEYVHPHNKCIVTQREVGQDTQSWELALKNTLRQAPDVIQIGEIRTTETMEYAIQFAETGHLVFSTLHANSANQALDRIINFFSEEKKAQVLMDLSFNLRAVISQRLVRKEGGGRVAAMEIMLNTPLIQDLIFKGEVHSLKDVMSRSNQQGMITFDQCLFNLFESGEISYEEALRNADSENQLRLNIKLNSNRVKKDLKNDKEVIALTMKGDEGESRLEFH